MKIATLKLAGPVLLAPMAGITNLPYRRIMKEFGAALVFSEMVSANGLIRDGRRTLELVRSCDAEKPLGIQLFADDPDVLGASVKHLGSAGDLLDINLGCPVNKVVRSGAGSALLRTPQKVGRLTAELRKATAKPITIKIRSGWDLQSINYLEIGHIAEDSGADAVTLHPRTRSQGFSGQADWEHIARLKQALKIPVIGSGDIFNADDGLRMLSETGCDGIMVGRGAYGNPWLIKNILRRLAGKPEVRPTAADRLQVAERHIQLMAEDVGIKKTMFEMRKHLCWYSRGLDGAAGFRQSINQTTSLEQLRQLTRDYFSRDEKCDASCSHAE